MIRRARLTLTPRQATAFTLRRQLVSEPASRPLDVFRRLIVIQAQYAASVPLAVHVRCPAVPAGWTEAALGLGRTLVKTWSVRGTLHASAAADLPLLVQSVCSARRARLESYLHEQALSPPRLRAANRAVLRALDQGARSRNELHRMVPALACIPYKAWGVDMKSLAYAGELVFADSEAGRVRFARRDRWLPKLAWQPPAVDEAQRELFLRYFSAFAPATLGDFAHWSGLPMKTARALSDACAAELVPATVEGWPGEHFVRAADVAAAREEFPPPPVALLPKFDTLVMGWRPRTRFVDAAHRAHVYRKAAQVEAVLLLDGRGAATWRMRQSASKLTLEVFPFRRLRAGERKLVEGAAARLAEFRGAPSAEVRVSA